MSLHFFTKLLSFALIAIFWAPSFSQAAPTRILSPRSKKAPATQKVVKAPEKTTEKKQADEKKEAPKAEPETKPAPTLAEPTPEKTDHPTPDPKKREAPKEDKSQQDEAPKHDTLDLKKERLRLIVKLNGVFESKKAEQVRLKGEVFTNFELKKAVAHGTTVNKGDVLIEFNAQKYQEALAEKKRALRLSELSLQEQEISLKYLQLRHPLSREAFERDKKYADEDLQYFLNIQQAMLTKIPRTNIKIAQFSVDTAKEELKQLEKMYAEDDLVEDTEEFILKRSKFMVDIYEFYYEIDKIYADRSLEITLPRLATSMRYSARLRDLSYRQNKETFDFILEQTKLRYENAKQTHAKLQEDFTKFRKDKDMLTLNAPCDGVVYYGDYNGKYSAGKWNNAAEVAASLKIEEDVRNGLILFTIIDPKPTQLRLTVPEKELHWIKIGTKGTVTPTAFPNVRYKTQVMQRNDIPSPAGDYVAMLSVDLPDEAAIFPSMTNSVELTVYEKKAAFLVPTAALKRDEMQRDSWNHAYLYVYNEAEKTIKKKKVKTGYIKGDKTELTGGVARGLKIFKKFEDGEKAQEKATKP